MENTTPHCVLVLVVQDSPLLQQELASTLASLRPSWRVHCVAPEDLETSLQREPAPVVICSEPTTVMQRRARAWAIVAPSGADVAYVGRQDGWSVVKPLTMAGVADALDEWLLRSEGPEHDQPLLRP
jgi:hypothetical protein